MVLRVLFFSAFTPHERAAAEKNTKIMLTKFDLNIMVDFVCFRYKNDAYYAPEKENVRVIKYLHNAKWLKLINVILLPFFHYYFSARFSLLNLIWLNKIVKKENYDVIIFDHSQLFLYAKWLKADCHKVLIAHDVMFQRVSRSTNSKLQKNICRWSERYCVTIPNSQIFTFSEKDCQLFAENYHINAKCTYDYLDERIAQCSPNTSNDYFVMFGNWKRADNLDGALWLIKEVLPLVNKKSKIKVIGIGFPIETVGTKINNVEIEYMGFVDNPYPIISGSRALLSPLFSGAGIKVKVLESLACGVPVIGTKIAFEGIPSKFKQFMIETDNVDSFLKQMIEISFKDEDRLDFKKFFLKEFQNETIPEYLTRFNKKTK